MATFKYSDGNDYYHIEIAICLDTIDRTKNGLYRFRIPAMNPQYFKKESAYITNLSFSPNLLNQDKPSYKVINACNYCKMYIPKEMLSTIDAEYNVEGSLYIDDENRNYGVNGSITITTPEEGGTITTPVSGSISLDDGDESYNVSGKLMATPTDKYRYISPGSTWLVSFIGGDITRPVIIGKYYKS